MDKVCIVLGIYKQPCKRPFFIDEWENMRDVSHNAYERLFKSTCFETEEERTKYIKV
jgi:hypothetical protein